jgi:serine/threonine-protein kinase PpkA
MKTFQSAKTISAVVGVAVQILFFCGFARADTLDEIAQRVRERQAQVEAAVSSGMAQEGAQGLLQSAPNADQTIQALVQAENKDRRDAFSQLAKKYKMPSDSVADLFSKMARPSAPANPPTTTNPSQPPPAQSSPASPTQPPSTPPPASNQTPANSPSPPAPPQAPAASPAGNPATVQTKQGTSIPLKVITRPSSSVYAEPSDTAPVVESNVDAFTVYYVYAEQPGWFQVGKTKNGGPFGWMKDKDAILYKQNLAMEFTQPAARLPVMLFRDKDPLKKIAEAPSAQRAAEAQSLLAKIKSGDLPPDFPVEAMEPNRATDSRTTPYFLPITEHEQMQIDGREARLLRVAGVTKSRTDQSLAQSAQPAGVSSASASAQLDLVFVMDCSSSMRPMVDATVEAMRGMVSKLAGDSAVRDGLRLGFWGYRDSKPDQDFDGSPVKNFTQELEAPDAFLKTLQSVEVSQNSAGDYAEDVYGGLSRAIADTRWRPDSLRCIVLVGDASAHPAGNPKNSSKTDAAQIRAEADAKRVYIASYYISRDSPLGSADRQIAESQFRELAKNRTTAASGEDFRLVEQSDLSALSDAFGKSSEAMVAQLSLLRSGQAPTAQPSAPKPGESVQDAAVRMANNMFSGAYVDWLARQKDTAQAPPGNVQSWVIDRDLKDPAQRPMDVVVLLRKNEVDSMAKVLDGVVTAGVRGQVTGQDFFQALQSVAASAVSSPDQIRNARNLAATGLLPEFLEGLPYESRLMKMDPATWNSLSVDSQNEILEQVRAKITFYENTLRDTSRWVAFNAGDDEDDKVAGIPLEQLP